MKKVIIIASAALLALAACTKVEVVDNTPAQKINFQVANYMTKAQGNNFQAEAPYFFTNAWYTPESGTANQHYMPNVKVELIDGAWQPAEPYYWPKTGTINFFSYASFNDLAAAEVNTGDADYGTTFAITGHTVAADDNIMIADAVYYAGKNAHNADGAMVTDDLKDGTSDSGYNGVPTMFRHLLAQVKFNIGLATKSTIAGTTNWTATVTKARLVKRAAKGSIELAAIAPEGTALQTKAWTPAADGTQVGWVAGTNAADSTELVFNNVTTALTLAADANPGNSEEFLGFTAVLPQTLTDDVVLEITLNLDTKHGDTVYASEQGIVVTALLNSAKANADDTAGIGTWCMNKRYTYNITIDPADGGFITFDPAVADWTTATGSIDYIAVP